MAEARISFQTFSEVVAKVAGSPFIKKGICIYFLYPTNIPSIVKQQSIK